MKGKTCFRAGKSVVLGCDTLAIILSLVVDGYITKLN